MGECERGEGGDSVEGFRDMGSARRCGGEIVRIVVKG